MSATTRRSARPPFATGWCYISRSAARAPARSSWRSNVYDHPLRRYAVQIAPPADEVMQSGSVEGDREALTALYDTMYTTSTSDNWGTVNFLRARPNGVPRPLKIKSPRLQQRPMRSAFNIKIFVFLSKMVLYLVSYLIVEESIRFKIRSSFKG